MINIHRIIRRAPFIIHIMTNEGFIPIHNIYYLAESFCRVKYWNESSVKIEIIILYPWNNKVPKVVNASRKRTGDIIFKWISDTRGVKIFNLYNVNNRMICYIIMYTFLLILL